MKVAVWTRALRVARRVLSRKNPSETDSGQSRLVAEIEAFLSGELVAELSQRGDPVPDWAWLNTLAHGDLCHVARLRRPTLLRVDRTGDWTADAWRTAQGLLAKDLLELSRSDSEALTRLQRTVLVPLELELIQAEEQLSALELVQSTRAALRSSTP